MASAASNSKTKVDTGRGCDVCNENITSFPMYHCMYCNNYDICSSMVCIRNADATHVKYCTQPIWSVDELKILMKHCTPTQKPHPPTTAPPSPLKKPKVPLGPMAGSLHPTYFGVTNSTAASAAASDDTEAFVPRRKGKGTNSSPNPQPAPAVPKNAIGR